MIDNDSSVSPYVRLCTFAIILKAVDHEKLHHNRQFNSGATIIHNFLGHGVSPKIPVVSVVNPELRLRTNFCFVGQPLSQLEKDFHF